MKMFFISWVFVFIGYHIHFKLRTKKYYNGPAENPNVETIEYKEVKALNFFCMEEGLLPETGADTGIYPIGGLDF